MELDKRIKEGKRPLTCFDIKEAEKYVGKLCYICDEYDFFYKLTLTEKTILTGVEDCEVPFHYDKDKQAEFCLPCEWVREEESEIKEPEKKYRPYSLNEFLNEHEIGDKITYRTCRFKDSKEQEFIRYKAMICGYQIMEGEANTPGKGFINLGGFWVSLQAMFDDYETPNSYLYPEVWQPFGVIEDD